MLLKFNSAGQKFSIFKTFIYLYTLIVWVGVCLFVCLYPVNVKTVEPIGPTGKVYNDQNFLLSSNKIRFLLNFENPRNLFIKSAKFFCFCSTMYTKIKCSQLKQQMPGKPSLSKSKENIVVFYLQRKLILSISLSCSAA